MRRRTIQACFPTWRSRVNPYRSNRSRLALKRKRPCTSSPLVSSVIASQAPPPAAAIKSSAPASAASATSCRRRRLST